MHLVVDFSLVINISQIDILLHLFHKIMGKQIVFINQEHIQARQLEITIIQNMCVCFSNIWSHYIKTILSI